jgi:hypothetical protein
MTLAGKDNARHIQSCWIGLLEFVEQDWSLKSHHRLIMLSDAYQRDSRFTSLKIPKLIRETFIYGA